MTSEEAEVQANALYRAAAWAFREFRRLPGNDTTGESMSARNTPLRDNSGNYIFCAKCKYRIATVQYHRDDVSVPLCKACAELIAPRQGKQSLMDFGKDSYAIHIP